MKHHNHLSNDMRQFLRKLRDQTVTLHEVTERAFIPRAVLQRWLTNRHFRRTLAGVMRGLRREGDVTLAVAARVAERTITDMLAGKIPMNRMQLMLCYAIVDLDHRKEEAKRRRARAKGAAKRPKFDAKPRPHPSHSPERARELLMELRALQMRKSPGEAIATDASDDPPE
jgi:hypothetical protein